jgi:hypothetical protein
VETSGIEPRTSWLQTRSSSVANEADKEVTSSQAARCTGGGIGDPKSESERAEDALATFVASLNAEQRVRPTDLLARGKKAKPEE